MKIGITCLMLLLAGCASTSRPAPTITLDEPPTAEVEGVPVAVPERVEIVEIPQPLPLPGQLKPVPAWPEAASGPADPKDRVTRANEEARIEPVLDHYINATQVWPYSPGALYQLYASPGHVTDIALEAGEELVSVSAGDTVRWIVGDTASGAGAQRQVHILVKPTASSLATNLVINTSRRTYHLELTATAATWMASVSWSYPGDRLLALTGGNAAAGSAAPIADGIVLERLNFRYRIEGDNPPWRPLNAFDDGVRVYVQFPSGIGQGELPPLFVIGASGDAELVNYRAKPPYLIVDRLFGAAELRLGGKRAEVVRIERTDAERRRRR